MKAKKEDDKMTRKTTVKVRLYIRGEYLSLGTKEHRQITLLKTTFHLSSGDRIKRALIHKGALFSM